MSLNPFFLQGSKTEQGLVQDLINEQLRMYGIEIYYIPRLFLKENTIIKEVVESEFDNAYPLEAYLETYDGYSGQGTILSKFGLQEMDDMSLVISKERFETYMIPLIQRIKNIKLPDRPKEGDLIYFPLGDRLFEIKYVEHEQPFYQLQKNYTYQLRCELYRYESGEIIDTGLDNIDDNVIDEGYIQTLQMVGFGSTATAYTGIFDNGVRLINITNMGHGYKYPPRVAISSAPSSGKTAIGTAILRNQIPDFCEPDPKLSKVYAVNLINPGYGYSKVPKVSFLKGGGSEAAATAVLGNGIVGIITITDPGSGYTIPPSVSFVGVSSVSAAATVILSDNGSISAIYLTDAGLGYTEPPEIVIGSPNILVGSGSYVFNEIVVGSISNTKARVKTWNIITKILEIGSPNGSFVEGENLIGQESNAIYSLKIINTDNLADPNDPKNLEDKFAQNYQLQKEGNKILDFSERNPFGTP